MGMDVDLHAREANLSCPYCHGPLLSGGLVWSCPSCATLHHRECVGENGGCTVLGCGERLDASKATEFVAAPPANGAIVVGAALLVLSVAVLGLVWGRARISGAAAASPPAATTPLTRPSPAPVAPAGYFPRATLSGPGGTVSLPLDRPAIVNVWLEGCPDCAPAFATWKELAKSPRRLPVVNVAYNGSTPGWADANGVGERLVFDRGGSSVVQPLGIGTFTTYVVAPDGRILFVGHPHDATFAAALDAAVERVEREQR